MKANILMLLLPLILMNNTVSNYNYNSQKNSLLHFKEPTNTLSITLSDVDAAADKLAPTNKIYTYKEAITLRKELSYELTLNPTSLELNWALMRFYTAAPNFVGGCTAIALQYAGYIFDINQYIGCMAYEYVYTRRKEYDKAELWYTHSTNLSLPKDMVWKEVYYDKTVPKNIKITGNFNNWKYQPMYESESGIYERKIMMRKCDKCIFKLLIDYKNTDTPTKENYTINMNND